MNKINSELRKQAILLGLCDKWQDDWRNDWDNDKLVSKMFEGINFCMKHHWPENDYIRENFTEEFRHSHAILADDKYSLLNPPKALILGKSESTIRFNGMSQGDIYIRDNANVTITAKDRARVYVKVYDNAIVTAKADNSARIVIVKCSPDISIKTDGNVIVSKPKV